MGFTTEKLSFKNLEGHMLDARLEIPDDQEIISYAIFVHCFTCSKNVHAASRISRSLTGAGIAVLRFDFTGLGNSDGDFSNTNFSTTVSDLVCAYEHMKRTGKEPSLLIGHSLGGSSVLAAAGFMPALKGIVTINAPSEIQHVEKLFDGKIHQIEKDGEAQVTLAGRSFTIRKQFLDDIRSIKLEDKIPHINSAFMIFHSPQDEVVSFDHAGVIYEAAKSAKSLISLDGASHLLNNKEDAEFVSRIISAWGIRYLSRKTEAIHSQNLRMVSS